MKCEICDKVGDDIPLCSGCHVVYYCSVDCQKSDRKAHKQLCNETKGKQEMFKYKTSFDHTSLRKELDGETPIPIESLARLEKFARQGQVQGQQVLADYYYLGKVCYGCN
jgi:hypothetical protein